MFTIKPSPSSEQFQVLCDMRTEGGGWVVIQNRYGGSENFNRSWDEYKRGFGKPPGEFWLGLEYVHAMTGGDTVLPVDISLQDVSNDEAIFKSHQFSVGSEKEGYAIRLVDKQVGRSLTKLAGTKFSTSDTTDGHGCAKTLGFGWWFNKNCTASNLNGNYPKEGDTKNNGVFWEEFRGMDNRLNITSIRLRAKVPRIH
ncbi:unnamed protein product [Callosobruchus maculatus]|nr:unnamed protein product [Callosobruchus maculatus]